MWQSNIGLILVMEIPVARNLVFILRRTLNTLRLRQNGRHFPDAIFKCIFLNENIWILIEISLKFVPKGQINNIPALVQIMAWRRPGDKPLPEPMMVSLLTHLCVTRPQWVKRFHWLFPAEFSVKEVELLFIFYWTHWGLYKKAAIFYIFFNCILFTGKFDILITISLKFDLRGPVDDNTD